MTASTRLESLRRAFWVALVPGAILFMLMQTVLYARAGMIGADSHAYWMAARFPATWYTKPPEYVDAYLYSPAFAQVLWPLGQLPWPAFQITWFVGQAAVLCWLLAPCGWVRGLTLALLFIPDLLLGNIFVFLAGALVLSLGRAPGALALPLLTKITPGLVEGLWFVVRGEWRILFRATGVTALIIAVSAAFAPGAWLDWARFLMDSTGHGSGTLVVRLAIAVGIAIWAARTSRVWALAPALLLAMPVLGAFVPYAVLAAVPRLLRMDGTRRAADAVPAHEQPHDPKATVIPG